MGDGVLIVVLDFSRARGGGGWDLLCVLVASFFVVWSCMPSYLNFLIVSSLGGVLLHVGFCCFLGPVVAHAVSWGLKSSEPRGWLCVFFVRLAFIGELLY